jgi:hypothetical protein
MEEYYDPPSDYIKDQKPVGGGREDDANALHINTFGFPLRPDILAGPKTVSPANSEGLILHHNFNTPITVEVIYDTTSDNKLAGMCMLTTQTDPSDGRLYGNIWSVAKDFNVGASDVFKRLLDRIIEKYPTIYVLFLDVDRFGTKTMTERGRLLYYYSLGFRLVPNRYVTTAVRASTGTVVFETTIAQADNGIVEVKTPAGEIRSFYVGALTGTFIDKNIPMYAKVKMLKKSPVPLAHKFFDDKVITINGDAIETPLYRNDFRNATIPLNLSVFTGTYHGNITTDERGVLKMMRVPDNCTFMTFTSLGSVTQTMAPLIPTLNSMFTPENLGWFLKKFKGYDTFPLHAVPLGGEADPYGIKFTAFHQRLGRRRQIDICIPTIVGSEGEVYHKFQMDIQIYTSGMVCLDQTLSYSTEEKATGFVGLVNKEGYAIDDGYFANSETTLSEYFRRLRANTPADRHVFFFLTSCAVVTYVEPTTGYGSPQYRSQYYEYAHNGSMRYVIPSILDLAPYLTSPSGVPSNLLTKCDGPNLTPDQVYRTQYAELLDDTPSGGTTEMEIDDTLPEEKPADMVIDEDVVPPAAAPPPLEMDAEPAPAAKEVAVPMPTDPSKLPGATVEQKRESFRQICEATIRSVGGNVFMAPNIVELEYRLVECLSTFATTPELTTRNANMVLDAQGTTILMLSSYVGNYENIVRLIKAGSVVTTVRPLTEENALDMFFANPRNVNNPRLKDVVDLFEEVSPALNSIYSYVTFQYVIKNNYPPFILDIVLQKLPGWYVEVLHNQELLNLINAQNEGAVYVRTVYHEIMSGHNRYLIPAIEARQAEFLKEYERERIQQRREEERKEEIRKLQAERSDQVERIRRLERRGARPDELTYERATLEGILNRINRAGGSGTRRVAKKRRTYRKKKY